MRNMLGPRWFTERSLVERTREIARVLSSHGLGVILHHGGLARFAPSAWREATGGQLTQAQRLG